MFNEIGRWVALKYQAQQRSKGTYQAALNMKKQGFPIEMTLDLLVRAHHFRCVR